MSKKSEKKDVTPAPHHCGLQGCGREAAITAEHRILGSDEPNHVCFCLEHARDVAKVIPTLIRQMIDGSLEEIRIQSSAKVSKDMEAGALSDETSEEVDHARKTGILAYLDITAPDSGIGALLGHHSDNAVMEAFATLIGALFRHGYLGMSNRNFGDERWTQVMSIGLIRALAHGGCTPKERLGVARVFVETAERLMKYKFTERV